MVQRLKVTHFYTAPTAIRMLIRKGDEWVKKYDRSSLRILGCGGLFVHYYTLRVFCILPLPYCSLLLHILLCCKCRVYTCMAVGIDIHVVMHFRV